MNNLDGTLLTRKELQAALKARGLKAVGSTEALRSAFNQARLSPAESSSPDRKRPVSTTTSSPGKEKRLRKLRTTISQQTRARIERAKTQRLYLIQRGEVKDGIECDFVVLGSTGNVYSVHVGHLPSCTCPDHQKGHLCKHILFIFLKVMGLDSESHVIYQAALVTSELKDMFASMEARQTGGVLANQQVRASYAASLHPDQQDEDATASGGVQRKSLDDAADCPICFDEMSQGVTYCRAMCGTNFHEDCIRRWLQQHRSNPTCPNCRQPWQHAAESARTDSREGYTNLGRLQGLSPVRDTSTYHSRWYYGGGSRYKRRRWY